VGVRQRHGRGGRGTADAGARGRLAAPGGAPVLTIGLPPPLQAAIDEELAGHSTSALAAASAAISGDYASGRTSARADETWHAAYLAARLPATYAAVSAALAMVPGHALGGVHTLLDLGAGPGTATWAALAQCPRLDAVLQIDRSAALLGIGARLGVAAAEGRAVALTQRVADLASTDVWPSSDAVIGAYILTELSSSGRARLVASAWGATTRLLVLVEPGTPDGFGHIHEARSALIAAGGHVIAPCPHEGPCPMRAAASREHDWCHFAVRVPRTRRHRQVKGGTLGYEDEKFAYLVVSREADAARAEARVLRHPRIEKGRILLTLCTSDGVQRQVVTRRDAAWRAARKSDWGDAWPDLTSS